ncbi:MAG TPA: response regulator transcription factor [Bacilli bacterium]|nr:response regulator transcription factor [Bacilli bacterium]
MEEILIIEDDQDIQKLLSICFEQEAMKYSITSSGLDAIEIVRKKSPSLILLDIMLPDIDGMEVCERIRLISTVPIIFVSCKNSNSDKILGLSLGGDDYIEKPFNIGVLMAKIRAHLRRNRLIERKNVLSKKIVWDNFSLDTNAREIYRENELIHVTTKEFDLLHFFLCHPNQVFSTEHLLDKIWGIDSLSEKRTVVVHISSLRKKIEEDPLNPKRIVTVRGVGYKFVFDKTN